VDFAFTDEQEALRVGVRTVLDTECTPEALRAFELADEVGRAEQSQNRWAVLVFQHLSNERVRLITEYPFWVGPWVLSFEFVR